MLSQNYYKNREIIYNFQNIEEDNGQFSGKNLAG